MSNLMNIKFSYPRRPFYYQRRLKHHCCRLRREGLVRKILDENIQPDKALGGYYYPNIVAALYPSEYDPTIGRYVYRSTYSTGYHYLTLHRLMSSIRANVLIWLHDPNDLTLEEQGFLKWITDYLEIKL